MRTKLINAAPVKQAPNFNMCEVLECSDGLIVLSTGEHLQNTFQGIVLMPGASEWRAGVSSNKFAKVAFQLSSITVEISN